MTDERERAFQYLAEHTVMSLATTGIDGPWSAAVFYVNEAFDLYFLSSPKSRHCLNLAAEARAAVTIQENYREWREIRGIQLAGRVEELTGTAAAAAREIYDAKFPFMQNMAGLPTAIAQALAKVRWYRVRADLCYFIDNSAGFGQRAEIDIGTGT